MLDLPKGQKTRSARYRKAVSMLKMKKRSTGPKRYKRPYGILLGAGGLLVTLLSHHALAQTSLLERWNGTSGLGFFVKKLSDNGGKSQQRTPGWDS